jgi:hypothetical protein
MHNATDTKNNKSVKADSFMKGAPTRLSFFRSYSH